MYDFLIMNSEEDIEKKNLQNLFWKSLSKHIKLPYELNSKIGSKFLKSNKYLLLN